MLSRAKGVGAGTKKLLEGNLDFTCLECYSEVVESMSPDPLGLKLSKNASYISINISLESLVLFQKDNFLSRRQLSMVNKILSHICYPHNTTMNKFGAHNL